jgi:hypothetical protein
MRFVAVTVVTVALLGGTSSGCTVAVAGNAVADRGAVATVPDPRSGAFGDPEGRFGLVPPSGWVVDTSGASGTAALFLNPKPTPTAAGSFTANINVLIVPNAAELAATVRDARLTSVRGYLPVEDAPFVLADGSPGHLLGGRFSDPAGFTLRNVQLFTVRGARTIVVTGTAPADTWDEYAPVFDSTLHTVTAGP